MQRTLGIDLGTTNSVMAHMTRGEPQILYNRDSSELTPSIVGRGKRGELLVGRSAKSRASIDPQNTINSVKRLMGRKYADTSVQKAIQMIGYLVAAGVDGDITLRFGDFEYSPTEISAMILRRLKEDAEARISEPFTRAVITVPAYFGERQVASTREAGRMAGFQVLRIINEPTAAALAFGLNREQTADSKTVLVYDLGGGTFDISILMLVQGTFAVLGIEGDNLLGGDDFDQLLLAHLLRAVQRECDTDLSKDLVAIHTLRSKAEEVKIALSGQEEVDVIVPALGPDAITLDIALSRAEFEAMIAPSIDRTIELTQKAIREAYLTPEQIDQVLLVGGSTAIPLVERRLREMFGADKIRKDVNPMQCVALGAALQTALITEVDCQECHAANPIHLDLCQQCGEPLTGRAKIACPRCYVLNNATDEVCRQCGSALVRTEGDGAPARKCPQCGKPYRNEDTICSICGATLGEQTGLKCADCGLVNAQGAQVCARCGKPIATELHDLTAKPLGIELSDGRLSVLIPKGTNFPTLEVFSKDFYTAIAGQQRLEVPIYEGFEALARQNDLCGIVMMRLPNDLGRGTPVNIAFGLDHDRTITVSVKIRAVSQNVKTVRLQRNRNPEETQRIEAARETLVKFLDKWTAKGELFEAEIANIYAMLDHLDEALNEDPAARRRPLAELLAETTRVEDVASEVRGTSAMITAVMVMGAKYIDPSLRDKLVRLEAQLQQARERGDWTEAAAIVQEADKEIWGLGDGLLHIIHARTFVNQYQLSPALEHRIFGALRAVDDGLDNGDTEQMRRGMDDLYGLWNELIREVKALGEQPPTLTGVVDRL